MAFHLRRFSLLLFLALPAAMQAQNFCLSESEGSNQDIEFAIDMDADPAGNLFVTGAYKTLCDFGGFQYPATGLTDLFLAKYNNNGSLAWIQHMGGTGPDRGNRVFFGPDDHVYLCGNVKLGVMPPQGPELLHAKDAMFARYDSAGANQWLDVVDGNNYSEAYGVSASPTGVLYGGAIFNTQAYFAADTLYSKGDDDILVAAYGPTGTELWQRSFGSKLKDGKPAVGSDAAGNVYLTGYFQDTLIAAGDTLISAGMGDVFVVKLTNSGTPLWAFSIPGSADDSPTAISVSADGSFAISGNFGASITFDVTYNALAADDGFIARYDANGQFQWVRIIAGGDYDQVNDVDEDPYGNYYFGGYSYGSMTIGAVPITNGGFEDAFFASLDPSGAVRYATGVPRSNSQFLFGLAVDPGENVYFGGSYFGSFALGSDTLHAVNNGEDIYWAKYGAAPSLLLDSISGPPHCLNDAFNVWFTARGCYESGNTFTVELSDSGGSFASPIVLGTLTAQSGGEMLVNVPGSITGGPGYRVRVIADAPNLVSNDNGFDMSLSVITSNPPVITGDSVICAGDSLVLDAGSGYASYDWNTGDTTQSIIVTAAGTYSVNVTDAGGCTGFASQEVVPCVSRSEIHLSTEVSLWPNPASGSVWVRYPGRVNEAALCDLEGRILRTWHSPGEDLISFSLSLPAGSYLMLLDGPAGVAVKKLQIQ